MKKPRGKKNEGHETSAVETLAGEFTPAEELALAEFDHWMDGELEQLVSRWIHLAAPNASRRERSLRRLL